VNLSIPPSELGEYVAAQLNNFFPDRNRIAATDLADPLDKAVQRAEFCFRHVRSRYFSRDGITFFDHLNSDQYAMFLYLLSNETHLGGNDSIATKLFYLNKALHGLDCFYSVALPPIFLFSHPVGSVLGRADYSDFFMVSQNCTIGDNFDGAYPSIGDSVIMYAGSSILGSCTVGNNCALAANALIFKASIPANSVVTGQHPDNGCRQTDRDLAAMHFVREV